MPVHCLNFSCGHLKADLAPKEFTWGGVLLIFWSGAQLSQILPVHNLFVSLFYHGLEAIELFSSQRSEDHPGLKMTTKYLQYYRGLIWKPLALSLPCHMALLLEAQLFPPFFTFLAMVIHYLVTLAQFDSPDPDTVLLWSSRSCWSPWWSRTSILWLSLQLQSCALWFFSGGGCSSFCCEVLCMWNSSELRWKSSVRLLAMSMAEPGFSSLKSSSNVIVLNNLTSQTQGRGRGSRLLW